MNENSNQINVDCYNDSDENDSDENHEIIVISSDEDDDRNNNFTYRRMMGVFSERTRVSLESFANNLTTNIISQTISAATPLQRCCICLSNILISREGINLHDNIHSIHIFCLMDFLANSQIVWLQTSFRFDCPLCRAPVFGTVMLIS